MDEQRSMMTGEVVENRQVAAGHFQMTIRLPLSFTAPSPGQFVMIRPAKHEEPILARPFSVYAFHRRASEAAVDLLYRVTGRGTSLLARLKPGETLSVLGALGNGFSIPDRIKKVVLVAGGVGVAPLAFFFQEWCRGEAAKGQMDTTVYLGAGSAGLLTGCDRLSGYCDLRICTDDGSRGYCGPVTELLRRDLAEYPPAETAIYACGPAPMIRSLGRLLMDVPVPCQVSLEARMACGLGACLGCAVAIRNDDGRVNYQRVCKDGPVFDLRQVVFATSAAG